MVTKKELIEFEIQLWALALQAIKGLATFGISLLYLVVVLFFTAFLWLFRLTTMGERSIREWQPRKPRVFGDFAQAESIPW